MTGDQLPSETYTACYFMCVDMAMIFQFVYYTLRSREALGLITAVRRGSGRVEGGIRIGMMGIVSLALVLVVNSLFPVGPSVDTPSTLPEIHGLRNRIWSVDPTQFTLEWSNGPKIG